MAGGIKVCTIFILKFVSQDILILDDFENHSKASKPVTPGLPAE